MERCPRRTLTGRYFADADVESEDYHLLQKGPSTTTEPALANLEAAQASVEKVPRRSSLAVCFRVFPPKPS